jgi:hypothetical protein
MLFPAGISERETMNQFPLIGFGFRFPNPKPQFRIRFIVSRPLHETVRIITFGNHARAEISPNSDF